MTYDCLLEREAWLGGGGGGAYHGGGGGGLRRGDAAPFLGVLGVPYFGVLKTPRVHRTKKLGTRF